MDNREELLAGNAAANLELLRKAVTDLCSDVRIMVDAAEASDVVGDFNQEDPLNALKWLRSYFDQYEDEKRKIKAGLEVQALRAASVGGQSRQSGGVRSKHSASIVAVSGIVGPWVSYMPHSHRCLFQALELLVPIVMRLECCTYALLQPQQSTTGAGEGKGGGGGGGGSGPRYMGKESFLCGVV